MKILLFLIYYPNIYFSIALLFSFYYGYREWIIKTHEVKKEQLSKSGGEWSVYEQIIVHRIQGFIFNFVGSMAGFIALYIECKLFLKIEDYSKIDIGTSVLIGTLAIIAIAGISGILPILIYFGRFPK